jgi:hypothetical protein
MKENLFNAPSDGVQAGAPTPTPAAPKVRKPRSKSTKARKVREPKVKDQRELDLLAIQKTDLAEFKGGQADARKELRRTIRLETHPPKPSRVERIAASLKPEEKAALLAALQS